MANRKVEFAPGEFFHIYNRGNSKQAIFLCDEDRDRFVKLLYLSNSKKSVNFRDDIVEREIDAFDFNRGEILVSIGSWVLMPNHFHIYVTFSPKSNLGEGKNNISEFMRKLLTSYTKYFNTKYNRTGSLFEGTFKSTHINNDGQAKYLFSYIHLNPVKLIDSRWKESGIADTSVALKYLNDYNWSSYQDCRGVIRKENKILERKSFPEYFSNKKEFDLEIFSWLKYKE